MMDPTWNDLTDEVARTYEFANGSVTIAAPVRLNVSGSGGHRVLDEAGVSHYIPAGWLHLSWTVKEGRPPFAF